MSTQKRLEPDDSPLYLNELTNFLTDDKEAVLANVIEKKARMCRDEITSFALSTVMDICPIWMYGSNQKTHFFIHPIAISTELKNYQKFLDAIDDVVDVDDDDTNVQHALHKTSRRYEFSFNSDKASFVSLQSIMNLNGLSKLDFGTEIDSLYMPIYDSGHCSLLILSIPRRTFLFLDSLSNERHRKIAELIRRMFVSAEMLFPTAYRVYELLTKTQAEDWECGWCALLFARWWRNANQETAISEAKSISIRHSEISELAKNIMVQQQLRKQMSFYNDRLTRQYNAVALFSK